MHRRPLLDLLDHYAPRHPEEAPRVERFRRFVRDHEDCFLRSCVPGHVTASAWIVDASRERFLLTHHKKLGRWLQLGGHADGETDVARVAVQEAREESGLEAFHFAFGGPTLVPIDVDIHDIPARPGEPAHEHFDLRFLLMAGPGQELAISAESLDLRWFPQAVIEEKTRSEESLLRLGRKASALLAGAFRTLPA